MTTAHPSWCVQTEPDRADHMSPTLHAAEPDDVIDIRLRLTQPEDECAEVSRWTSVELHFVDHGGVISFPLDMRQAAVLRDCLARLLPPGEAGGGVGVPLGLPDEAGSAHTHLSDLRG
jgi:hypothetical protein